MESETSGGSRTGIIDYGGGNLRSVRNALEFLGADIRLISASADLEGIDRLVFPGQGAFGDCMNQLEARGLVSPLRSWLREDRPFFGICIGYQVLFESSEESPGTEGLGFLSGTVKRFPSTMGLKVPHMGWNALKLADPADPIWRSLPEKPYFYFVHSYYPAPEDPAAIGSTADYGIEFAASIRQGRAVATQFHPERSQKLGMTLLRNFLSQPVPDTPAGA